MKTTTRYDALAKLLAYPEAPFDNRIRACHAALDDQSEEAAAHLRRFESAVEGLSVEDLQELYTRTFDLNPICTLELGWQLFGENYSRGEFLVAMRQTLRRLDVEESTELPDHLTHALAAFGRMPEAEAGRFASMYLVPALEKMTLGLGSSGKDCPYADVLKAARALIGVVSSTPTAEDRPRGLSVALPIVDPTTEVCHG